MKKEGLLITLFLPALLLLASCIRNDSKDELITQEKTLLGQYLSDNSITREPTSSGLYYIPIVEGTGIKPVEGSWVEIEYTGELVDGTVFATSYDSVAKLHGLFDEDFLYGPTRLMVGLISLDGLNEGLQYMNAGGTGKFIIPSDLGWGALSLNSIPPYSTLIYTIDLLDTYNDPGAHERELIQQFLADSNFTADSTETGLYYIEQVEGSGDYITSGKRADVRYTGSFLDGRIFDSNIGEELFSVYIPATNLIEGWNEGLLLMREGSKGILIVPYYLGYGEWGLTDNYGRTKIPPHMTLVFEMEIEKIY